MYIKFKFVNKIVFCFIIKKHINPEGKETPNGDYVGL